MKDLIKHSREFLRAIRNRKFERSADGGILFYEQSVNFRGVGAIRNITKNEPWEDAPNIVTIQGINYLFTTGLNSGAAAGTWYFAPYAAAVAPVNTLTAANFNATQTEFTNYTETARQECNFADAAAASITNTATPATITIGASGQTSVYGFGITSVATKSSGSGVLLAVPALTAGRTGLQATDQYGLKYTLNGTST